MSSGPLLYSFGVSLALSMAAGQDSGMALEFTTSYLRESLDLFRYYKELGERAMEQSPDAQR